MKESPEEPLFCDGINCGKDITYADDVVYSHTGGVYCSDDCKDNTEPMSAPTTGRAANTRGGRRQSRRGADIRWEVTQSAMITEYELRQMDEAQILSLRNWLKCYVKKDQHNLIDHADIRRLSIFERQVRAHIEKIKQRRALKDSIKTG